MLQGLLQYIWVAEVKDGQLHITRDAENNNKGYGHPRPLYKQSHPLVVNLSLQ